MMTSIFRYGLSISFLFLINCTPAQNDIQLSTLPLDNFDSSQDNNSIKIKPMGLHQIRLGKTFVFQPEISGEINLCRKDLGHDDVQVDSQTGQISWDTSKLNFGRGFHIRIKCSNYSGFDYASMVVHVDATGSSRLRVAGKNGISKYIASAATQMDSGDTIVFPDGIYPVSVSGNGSYENALKRSAPTNGAARQFSTIIAQSPGGVTVTGESRNGLKKQKNAFQLSETQFVAVVGFVIKQVQRESFTTVGSGKHLLIDFVGTEGAGTWGASCANFVQAKAGQCSNAGMRINGGTPLIQSSYNWGHNRYGIMTRSTQGSITRRSFVRLDEHKGDQPYGGFSDYCDSDHLSQDNVVFDSLAIAAPHYKNYAGLSAYPATGCAGKDARLKTVGLLAINNQLSLSLMDAQAGPPHVWRNIVSYDSEGTCTPQKDRCGAWLLQAKKETIVTESFFGKARGFQGSTTLRGAFDFKDVKLADNVILFDIPGYPDQGTPPRYLPESQLYFNGRSDTFYGEPGSDEVTSSRRWPIPGEDIIARNMRAYYNRAALKVGGGEVEINGNRGAVASATSMSEYFWGYKDSLIPPLVVRVKKTAQGNRIAWEHFTGNQRQRVKGWQLYCADNQKILANLAEPQLSFTDKSGACGAYAVRTIYEQGVSGIAYVEKAR